MDAQHLIGPRSPLRILQRQRRLVACDLVILMPVDGYYAQRECARALRALGHRVVEVVLGERGESGAVHENLGKLLSAMAQHRPDMMLSINYTGFDRANYLSEAIEATGLPTAVWFVDHPMILAQGWLPPSPKCTSFFVWDRSFVGHLRALGAERTFHLPLGTDEHIFCPAQGTQAQTQPTGFVGHSLGILEAKWRRELQATEWHQAQEMAQALYADRQVLHTLVPHMQAPFDRQALVLAAGCVLASKRYRMELLLALPQASLHLTGDAHWRTLMPQANYRPTTDYGEASAAIYRDTVISVNATNLQMPSTVNQRVFDVPAAGGFLITDRQPEMEALYDGGPNGEMVTFETQEQLVDLVAYYSAHPAERLAMAARARRRVLAHHTYTHRMRALVATMREQHASMAAGAVASIKPD